MADNVAVTAGTGTSIAADELVDGVLGTVKVQYVKLMDGTIDGSTKAAVGAGGLKVDPSGVTSPISAASLPLPALAATSTKQSDGSQKTQVVDGSGNIMPSGDTVARAMFEKITDGTNTASVKAVSTAPVTATDSALVTVLRPDSAGIIATGTQASPSASYLSTVAAGDIAAAATDSGNPVKIGAKATNAEPTALTTGQRANLISDLVGKLIVLPYANPENFVSGAITTAMTATTSTSLIAAPAAGLRNYVTQITVSNSHATVGTDVAIQDGVSGTTFYTVPAAAVYGGAVISFPTPLKQPTLATALACVNVTTGASTKVSASGYKGA